MNKFLDIVAKVLSYILYPLFVPTYGVALFCYSFQRAVLPLTTAWIIVAIAGTFVFTCLIPMTTIWILTRAGKVQNMQIKNAAERTTPYIYTTLAFSFWLYFMVSILRAPVYLGWIAIGATVAIALVALINLWWKISAHLTAFGGLFGGLMTYCLGINGIPTLGTLALWLGLSLLLMCARLRLYAHTPAQVCAGWLLGMTCTFVPYCIYVYVG